MYPTLEMRWFWYDTLPPAIDQWFRGRTKLSAEPEREDWYLCLPDTIALGIKLREGKLEIKKRLIDRGIQTFGDRLQTCLEGRMEMWTKWSFESSSPIDCSNPAGVWLAVKKSRQQQTYTVTSNRVEEIDLETVATIPQGCNLELAELSIENQRWFSVCFEAFGNEASIESTLQQTIIHVLEIANFPTVTTENSFSYPAWLQQRLK